MAESDETPIEIPTSSLVLNPIQAAITVLAGFVGGYFVKAGLITNDQLAVVVPATLTLAYAAFRAYVSHKRASRAVIMAEASPNTVAFVK